MLDVLVRQFANVLAVSILGLLLILGLRVYRILLLFFNADPALFFQFDGYFALYVIHNLASVLYYHLTIAATFRLSDPSFYDPTVWRRTI